MAEKEELIKEILKGGSDAVKAFDALQEMGLANDPEVQAAIKKLSDEGDERTANNKQLKEKYRAKKFKHNIFLFKGEDSESFCFTLADFLTDHPHLEVAHMAASAYATPYGYHGGWVVIFKEKPQF